MELQLVHIFDDSSTSNYSCASAADCLPAKHTRTETAHVRLSVKYKANGSLMCECVCVCVSCRCCSGWVGYQVCPACVCVCFGVPALATITHSCVIWKRACVLLKTPTYICWRRRRRRRCRCRHRCIDVRANYYWWPTDPGTMVLPPSHHLNSPTTTTVATSSVVDDGVGEIRSGWYRTTYCSMMRCRQRCQQIACRCWSRRAFAWGLSIVWACIFPSSAYKHIICIERARDRVIIVVDCNYLQI